MGPGINRMNVYTVRQATEGLATLMDSLGDDIKKRGVRYWLRFSAQLP